MNTDRVGKGSAENSDHSDHSSTFCTVVEHFTDYLPSTYNVRNSALSNLSLVEQLKDYTVKKVSDFPVPSRNVRNN